MRHFIKLPQVIISETYSETENHNTGLNKNNIIIAQISTIHLASCPDLNGTAVLQSIDLQTEKIEKSKNQNDCGRRSRRGPGILLAARIRLDKSHVTFQSESPGKVYFNENCCQQVYMGQSSQDFLLKWNKWQQDCRTRLESGEFSNYKELKLICEVRLIHFTIYL